MGKNNTKKHSSIFLIMLFVISFLLAMAISTFTQVMLSRIASVWISFLMLFSIIVVGVAFDIIGIAATAATEVPFHAKAAKRVFGASQALKLIRNADKVAIFTIDVVGDISGPISGALGAAIVFEILKSHPSPREAFIETLMTAVIASVTVTGKAIGKSFAIYEANNIIFKVGKLWAVVEKPMAFFARGNDRKRGN